ncbi:heavy metal translocating P-type ATPase (plasmid) [Nitratireductor rhodophyticola]|uniref:P-type Zn(2+) transporter n=1 Tax=Nitratireductor rhodophyticola TaxID=2854036 RepID=A0ABS7RDP0_9HYPH|nr:heavy metal translocating P-type ATPase [Nitratireductor rhodophyticola]MAS13081.1 heavy metal translocating P-type ATPase [Nitratireductor sp.]MBY8919024.1 heavy metal translocating P-type ATPase [Nitratireductor rhodophyticola]MBY8923125.1 heavy metal translocating P-type ATPase [Nitratireductor rhodophyticola]WPZ16261.1 heavy metal translocating P-type ATPase [Nitratireductor rhodophyticola]
MTSKLRLDIPVLLPEIDDVADACVKRLTDDLEVRTGVERVHIVAGAGAEPAKLCLHYDPEILPLARIREIARTAGAQISARFGHLTWNVSGIGHERRARTVAAKLRSLDGILEAEASAAGLVHIEFDRSTISEDSIASSMRDLGVKRVGDASPALAGKQDAHAGHDHGPGERHSEGDGHDHSHGEFLGPNTELIFALTCGALLGIGYAIEKLVSGAPGWLPTACYIAAYFFGGFFTLREAIDNLRLKRFEIDTLMLVAAAGAAALGAFAEGALLLFLFSLGHALEHYAMGRAKRAIEALAELAPSVATVRREGETAEIPVEELVVGDIVVVRPNERLPADGFLSKGTTSVNQAPVTGESIPVDKRPVADVAAARARPDSVDGASRVFAGTINGAGAIEIEVTRRSTESALAKVVKMVSEAEAQKSPTQRFTEKFERIFVPAVLVLAILMLFGWVVIDEPFRDSFYRAMAVLVAASPCALAIATPSAVLSGVARAARGGVLVKGGGPLENLGSLTAIAFDKTGTLTEGRPRITDIVAADGITEQELLEVAIAVESLSDHPLAEAIVRDGREKLSGKVAAAASDLKSLTGKGVTATVDGQTVWIGKAEMFGSEGVPALSRAMMEAVTRLRDGGRTTMVVRRGDRDLGVIGLMDTPRGAARDALAKLHEIGVTRMIMISGDNQKVADAIAKDVGLDEAWGDLMPEDKVEAIKKLRSKGKVAMVGDGVNDAPAMASATVGIAMGAAGSDVALETADVALMVDDLSHLPFAVGLSRQTRSIILQNVVVSLGIVAVLVPATIFGLSIGAAVAVHEGSTLLVVFNALRLLAYRDPYRAAA